MLRLNAANVIMLTRCFAEWRNVPKDIQDHILEAHNQEQGREQTQEQGMEQRNHQTEPQPNQPQQLQEEEGKVELQKQRHPDQLEKEETQAMHTD